MNGWSQRLMTGLEELNIDYTTEAIHQMLRFSEDMLETNRVMNLTAIREMEDVIPLHLLDSASVLTAVEVQGRSVVDVGCGAGFPGMPLKLLRPGMDLTLLDSLRKRVDFLTGRIGAYGLTGVRAQHARAEEWAGEHREEYDVALSRAVAALPVLCELCLPLIRIGGVFCAMKSTGCDEEVSRADRAIETLGGRVRSLRDVAIPHTDVVHRLVLIDKVRPTPAPYPRPFRKISARPL